MFKLIPLNKKIPLIENWTQKASNDQSQLDAWSHAFGERLTHWGIPTGKTNNVLVLDVDKASGGLETLKTLKLPDTMWQWTGGGGVHFVFKYPNNGHTYTNKVGILPGIDVRGEGGQIAHYLLNGSFIADAPDWLLKACLKHDSPSPAHPVGVSPYLAHNTLSEVLEVIKTAKPGTRNHTLNLEAFKIAQIVASGGIPREYAENLLIKAGLDIGLDKSEVHATINSAFAGGERKPLTGPFPETKPIFAIEIPPPPGPPVRWTPNYFSESDILSTDHLRRPQIFKHWSTEDIHLTTADGGTGKTTHKLQEAVCLAFGLPFLGFDCLQKGKTLFITGEDTEKKLAALIGQIARQMGILNEPDSKDRIKHLLESILIKKDSDLCLVQKDRNGFIYPSHDAMTNVMQAVEDFKPKLIVFDPISSFWGSEAALNDMAKAVGKFMGELVQKSNACVEIINHMGKQSSTQKDMSQFAGRGGTGLPSNSRVSRVMFGIDSDEFMDLTNQSLEANQSAIKVNVNKFTDGSPLYNKPFLLIREGYLFKRLTLSSQKEREVEKSMTDTERVFSFVKSERTSGRYPSVDIVVAHFMAHSDSISEARVKRAVQMLQYVGHIGEKVQVISNPDQSLTNKVLDVVPC